MTMTFTTFGNDCEPHLDALTGSTAQGVPLRTISATGPTPEPVNEAAAASAAPRQELTARAAADQELILAVDRFTDGTATHGEVVEAAERWRHDGRDPMEILAEHDATITAPLEAAIEALNVRLNASSALGLSAIFMADAVGVEAVEEEQRLFVDGVRAKALKPLDEAIRAVGLPAGSTVTELITHHRGNAGLAVAFESLGEQLRAKKLDLDRDALIAVILSAKHDQAGVERITALGPMNPQVHDAGQITDRILEARAAREPVLPATHHDAAGWWGIRKTSGGPDLRLSHWTEADAIAAAAYNSERWGPHEVLTPAPTA
jgi:hypothetical protein